MCWISQAHAKCKANCMIGVGGSYDWIYSCWHTPGVSCQPGCCKACFAVTGWDAPRAYVLGPERWWTMPVQVEARGNPGGRPQRFWRANRSSEVGIGAKDQSNHLVAGSHRSFPQDSWCSVVKRVSSGKVNDQGSWGRNDLNLFSNYKLVRTWAFLNEAHWMDPWVPSGPVLVSRTGAVGWTKRWAKVDKSMLIRHQKRRCLLKTAGRWPWKLASAKECVTTHLPKQAALKMDSA